MNTLRDLFVTNVAKASDHLFLVDSQRWLTYELAYHQACQRAHILLNAGIKPQDRIFILDEDHVETVLWQLACSLTGIVYIILHRHTSPPHMRILLEELDPAGIIDIRSNAASFYQQSQLRLVIHKQQQEFFSPENTSLPSIDILETDPAFLVCTSGSTSRPKAVICPHRAVLAATSSINSYLPNTPEDRIGHILPLSFVYGLYQIFTAIEAQATLVFLEEFRSPLHLLTQLKELHITGFPTTRSLLVSLTRLPSLYFQDLSLQYITSAGEYLPPLLVQQVAQKFASCQFFSMYGLSECSRALFMPPDRLLQKPASVGRPVSGTRAFIVDEADTILEIGQIGELVVEGPHVMNGYWNTSTESLTRFARGVYGQPRLYTGDLFYQDSDGDFYFVARKHNMIKSRGFRISPFEVETLLQEADPHIQDCLVYGVDDDLLGQSIHALVTVGDASHTVKDIFIACQAAIDAHLVPSHIEIVDSLPTTLSGKHLRNAISALCHKKSE